MRGMVRGLSTYLGRSRTRTRMVLHVHRVSGRGRSTGVVHTALNALSLVGAVKGPISCARHCSSTCSGCTFFIIMISELSSKGACGRSDPGFRQPRHDRRSLRLTGGGHGKFYYILLPGILAQCVPVVRVVCARGGVLAVPRSAPPASPGPFFF